MVDNVAPKQVWDALKSDKTARLVDVRTDFEWSQIGVPDMHDAPNPAAFVSWQVAPTMQVNPAFIDQLREAGVAEDDHIYFLCRSGARSMAAAHAAEDAGFKHTYNVEDGFEGPPDGMGQRGRQAGWQADGLPWKKA